MAVRQRIATRSAYPLGPVDDPFPTAVHEGSHCMITFLAGAGSQIEYVAISETSGRMRLRNADSLNCEILMAGMAGEIVVLGFCEKERASTDLYYARRIARSTCSGDVEAFLERELNRAIALLQSHRDTLLALAREIMDRRYLSGDEVNEVLVGLH
jgi:hypothetical protein